MNYCRYVEYSWLASRQGKTNQNAKYLYFGNNILHKMVSGNGISTGNITMFVYPCREKLLKCFVVSYFTFLLKVRSGLHMEILEKVSLESIDSVLPVQIASFLQTLSSCETHYKNFQRELDLILRLWFFTPSVLLAGQAIETNQITCKRFFLRMSDKRFVVNKSNFTALKASPAGIYLFKVNN